MVACLTRQHHIPLPSAPMNRTRKMEVSSEYTDSRFSWSVGLAYDSFEPEAAESIISLTRLHQQARMTRPCSDLSDRS